MASPETLVELVNSRKHSRLRKHQQRRKELRAVLRQFVENYRASVQKALARHGAPTSLSVGEVCALASAAVDAALSSARERPGRA